MRNDPLCVFTVRGIPVSANAMYGTRSDGRRFLTKAARAWKKIVSEEAWVMWHEQVKQHYSASHLLVGETLQVVCTFYGVPQMDVDNLLKCTIDGLKTGIGIDDKYFNDVKAERGHSTASTAKGAVITITAQSVEALFTQDRPFLDAETIAPIGRGIARRAAKKRKSATRRAS